MESSLTLPAKIVDLSDIFVIFDLKTVREDAILLSISTTTPIIINESTINQSWKRYE